MLKKKRDKEGEEMKGKKKDVGETKEDHDSTKVNANPRRYFLKKKCEETNFSTFSSSFAWEKGKNASKSLNECNHTMQVSFEGQRSGMSYHFSHDWRKGSGESFVRLGSKCEFATILLQAIGTWPFLTTSNAIINCRNGLMQLTFGNMTLELNIFYISKKEVCIIDTLVEEHCNHNMQDKLNESLRDLKEGLSEPSDVLATLQSWRRREEILPLFNKEEGEVEEETPTPI
ncbi:hypothetical protein AAG906_007842 [Vitis piasezkii]